MKEKKTIVENNLATTARLWHKNSQKKKKTNERAGQPRNCNKAVALKRTKEKKTREQTNVELGGEKKKQSTCTSSCTWITCSVALAGCT
jgi:hypothetical protein